MPNLKLTVNVNLSGLRKFRETLEGDLRRKENGPIREALHTWAVLITRFLTARWRQYSRGAGDWRPLKAATLAQKRRKGLLPFILRAFDETFQAFAPEIAKKPGRLTEDIPFGIRFGFGGGMAYPHSHGKGITLKEIAEIHQGGLGNVPVRKIIVPPDTTTRAQMREVMNQAVREAAHQ